MRYFRMSVCLVSPHQVELDVQPAQLLALALEVALHELLVLLALEVEAHDQVSGREDVNAPVLLFGARAALLFLEQHFDFVDADWSGY